ncbi:hypothetical protein CPB83DRAFT_895689 [Crepidotus variabilis]|uniref:Uncharacterized protein n=1 Tax=Crepidotus variabilis TaxID=179855 RepID=A0A9P6EDP1_9AGAR|nr:hypothetical protein CPB83DRAFT_895689 [Crepidotus variabilis]
MPRASPDRAALRAVHECIPWSNLEECLEEDKRWFSLSKTVPSVAAVAKRQAVQKPSPRLPNSDPVSEGSSTLAEKNNRSAAPQTLNRSQFLLSKPTANERALNFSTTTAQPSLTSSSPESSTSQPLTTEPLSYKPAATLSNGAISNPQSFTSLDAYCDEDSDSTVETSKSPSAASQANRANSSVPLQRMNLRSPSPMEAELDKIANTLLASQDDVLDGGKKSRNNEEPAEQSSSEEESGRLSVPQINAPPSTQPSLPPMTLRSSSNRSTQATPDGVPSLPSRALRSSSSNTPAAAAIAPTSAEAPPPKRTAKKRKRALTTTKGKNGLDKKAAEYEESYVIPKRIHLDLQAGNTPDNPICIDMDQYSLFNFLGDKLERLESDLKPIFGSELPQRVTTKTPLSVWDASCNKHELIPRFHHEEELVQFVQFMASVASNYVDGAPKHVTSPKESFFYTMNYDEYSRMKDVEILSLLKRKCIVIHNMNWPDMAFDERGLSTLSPLDAVISIQGMNLIKPFTLPKNLIQLASRSEPAAPEGWI